MTQNILANSFLYIERHFKSLFLIPGKRELGKVESRGCINGADAEGVSCSQQRSKGGQTPRGEGHILSSSAHFLTPLKGVAIVIMLIVCNA